MIEFLEIFEFSWNGLIASTLGEVDDSILDCWQASLKFYEKTENKPDIASSLHQIGRVYYDRGELDRALEYVAKAFLRASYLPPVSVKMIERVLFKILKQIPSQESRPILTKILGEEAAQQIMEQFTRCT